ncbi:MAG TPA: glycerate kinase, partial [Candidatus Methylomirabilis sp.]
LRVEGQRLLAGPARFELTSFRRVLVVGAGKAGAALAAAVEEMLGDRVAGGLVTVKAGHTAPLWRVRLCEAAHPVPDEAGVDGARRMLALLRDAGQGDLVVACISGGGSALLPLPAEGLGLSDKQVVTRELLACGATIREINAVRKHLSGVKGGLLARAAAPAPVLACIVSDVIGDPLDAIASGPTAPDPTTFGDALGILDRYGLREKVPAGARAHLEAGARGERPETPKPGDPIFARVTNVLVANSTQALEAAELEANRLGLRALLLSTTVDGETREVARVHAAVAREVRTFGRPVAPPACVISGGETTVTLRGQGKGGRNQEFVLAAAVALEGVPGVVVFSAGTDGTDGPTDAAGAVADGDTCARARALGLDPQAHLDRNDAYPLFQALGDLVITGPTLTNVMDLRLLLIG